LKRNSFDIRPAVEEKRISAHVAGVRRPRSKKRVTPDISLANLKIKK
jgi:hypothetical protein